jgi:hypothetical protein
MCSCRVPFLSGYNSTEFRSLDFLSVAPGILTLSAFWSTRETLESLRLVVRRLQLSRDPAWDTRSLVELKRIPRKRIACLEVADAQERRPSDRWAA